MYKIFRSSAVLLFGVLASFFNGEAEGKEIEAPHNVLSPRRIIMPNPGQRLPVEISDINARVAVSGSHAVTSLVVTVKNPGSVGTEAELLFPVPADAVLKKFSYGEKAGQYPARLLPADEARRIYDAIVARAKDPALLEFAGLGTIRTSVFPIPARSSVKMEIVYEQVLVSQAGMYNYVLPRTSATDQKTNWDIRVEIDSVVKDNVFCPTHETRTNNIRGGCALVLDKSVPVNPGAVRLSWVTEGEGNSGLRVFACPEKERRESGYFMLLYGAEKSLIEESRKNRIKREITFVLDRSGSMRGEKMEQVKKAVGEVIKGLDEGELFNIITYNEGVDVFSASPVGKSTATEKEASIWLDGLTARGGTNISEAMETALKQPITEGTLPLVIFLTDGRPTIGELSENAIVKMTEEKNVAGRRIFTLGVGVDLNAPLLRRLVEKSKGEPAFILPGHDVTHEVMQLAGKLNNPLLSDVVLEIRDEKGLPVPGAVRDVLPSSLPDLYEGSQLIILGQYTGKNSQEGITFLLKGRNASGNIERKVVFRADQVASMRDDFVSRLWAMRRIGALQAELQKMGAGDADRRELMQNPKTKEVIEEMVNLSLEFGIMTEFTSFFADDGSGGGRLLDPGIQMGQLQGSGELHRRDVLKIAEESVFQERSGIGAVAKEMNITQNNFGKVANNTFSSINIDGKNIHAEPVRQIASNTYYKQGNVWVENSLNEKGSHKVVSLKQKHDRVVTLGTPEYSRIVDQLVKENRQGILALDGDINIRLGNEFILIKNTIN